MFFMNQSGYFVKLKRTAPIAAAPLTAPANTLFARKS
jgi:hypothetical protein